MHPPTLRQDRRQSFRHAASTVWAVPAFCAALLVSTLALAPWAHADWLVTQDGQLIETQGAWEVQGRMVVFTSDRGTLSSIRLDEVDLDASRAATEQAARPAPTPDESKPAPPAPSVLSLTNQDVARGIGGAEGADAVVERLRLAHGLKDASAVSNLVHWQDTPKGIRDVMETQFEWLMERRIQDIQLVEVPEDEVMTQDVDGVTYEPNVDVTHEMVINCVPDPDADTLTLRLLVGEHLGTHFIAAARPAEDF